MNAREAVIRENRLAKLVYKAKLAEQAERFGQMKELMKEVILDAKTLDAEGQRLFAVAFKNHVGRLRAARKIAESSKEKYAQKNPTLSSYASLYETEMRDNVENGCKDVEQCLNVLRDPSINDPGVIAFYCKMDADYKRYRAELDSSFIDEAERAYIKASEAAEAIRGHPTALGIALNYSVFKYEQRHDVIAAKDITERALMTSSTSKSRDAILVHQLLKDNKELWENEISKKNAPASLLRGVVA